MVSFVPRLCTCMERIHSWEETNTFYLFSGHNHQAQAAADSLGFCKGPPFPCLSLFFLLHHCVKLPNEMPSRHPEFLLDSYCLSISLPAQPPAQSHFLHNHLANNCLLVGKLFSASHFLQPLKLAFISISKHTLEQQKKEVHLCERFLMICHGSQDVSEIKIACT